MQNAHSCTFLTASFGGHLKRYCENGIVNRTVARKVGDHALGLAIIPALGWQFIIHRVAIVQSGGTRS